MSFTKRPVTLTTYAKRSKAFGRKPRRSRRPFVNTLFSALLILVVIGLVVELGLYGFILYKGNREVPQKSDLILVLGAQINEDQPSPHLQHRLDKAVELYNDGYGEMVLVSGGQGSDEIMTEAQVMKNYLIKRGVPAERILTEEQATSTRENAVFSKRIMDLRGYKSAVVVTNDFHIYRGLKEVRKAGIQATGAAAPTGKWWQQYAKIRETIAVVYYWIKG